MKHKSISCISNENLVSDGDVLCIKLILYFEILENMSSAYFNFLYFLDRVNEEYHQFYLFLFILMYLLENVIHGSYCI